MLLALIMALVFLVPTGCEILFAMAYRMRNAQRLDHTQSRAWKPESSLLEQPPFTPPSHAKCRILGGDTKDITSMTSRSLLHGSCDYGTVVDETM